MMPRMSRLSGFGEPVQLDEQLGDDRRGRDADRARDDERLPRPPAEREAEGEAAADVQREVDGARRSRAATATRGEVAERELEPEVEQQQDEAERGEQLEVLGIVDECDPGRVRTEDDSREP